MPRLTNAHKELIDITNDLISGGDIDAADDLIRSLIAHLSHKDAKEFVELWRSDSEEEDDSDDC